MAEPRREMMKMCCLRHGVAIESYPDATGDDAGEKRSVPCMSQLEHDFLLHLCSLTYASSINIEGKIQLFLLRFIAFNYQGSYSSLNFKESLTLETS